MSYSPREDNCSLARFKTVLPISGSSFNASVSPAIAFWYVSLNCLYASEYRVPVKFSSEVHKLRSAVLSVRTTEENVFFKDTALLSADVAAVS